MTDEARFDIVYTSPDVRVGLWSCTGSCRDPGPVESTRFHEIVFQRAGLYLLHRGSERIVGDPNHVLFFNAGEEYRISHPAEGGDLCTVFLLTESALGQLLTPEDSGAPPERARFKRSHALVDRASYLAHWWLTRLLIEGPTADPLAVEEGVAYVLRRGVRLVERGARTPQPRRAETARHHREAVEAVKMFVATRLSERLTLDGIASAVAYSKYHLSAIFRREVGLPIHRYVSRLRLRLALERLGDAGVDLSRLAFALGFSSHSHFSNAFRREFGLTPSEAKKLWSACRHRDLGRRLHEGR